VKLKKGKSASVKRKSAGAFVVNALFHCCKSAVRQNEEPEMHDNVPARRAALKMLANGSATLAEVAELANNDAEFGKVSPDRIDDGRLLAD